MVTVDVREGQPPRERYWLSNTTMSWDHQWPVNGALDLHRGPGRICYFWTEIQQTSVTLSHLPSSEGSKARARHILRSPVV